MISATQRFKENLQVADYWLIDILSVSSKCCVYKHINRLLIAFLVKINEWINSFFAFFCSFFSWVKNKQLQTGPVVRPLANLSFPQILPAQWFCFLLFILVWSSVHPNTVLTGWRGNDSQDSGLWNWGCQHVFLILCLNFGMNSPLKMPEQSIAEYGVRNSGSILFHCSGGTRYGQFMVRRSHGACCYWQAEILPAHGGGHQGRVSRSVVQPASFTGPSLTAVAFVLLNNPFYFGRPFLPSFSTVPFWNTAHNKPTVSK